MVDASDPWHTRAKACVGTAEEGWITTWPVVTEACHLLGKRLGPEFATQLLCRDFGAYRWKNRKLFHNLLAGAVSGKAVPSANSRLAGPRGARRVLS